MKKILIAEDRPSSRELIRTVLEGCGYDVSEASDGRQAVEVARRENPDLLIVDLQMPSLDGLGVLAELRSDPRFAEVPIVALTASAMQGDRERALEAGFTEYITKPVNLRFLREEITRLLNA
ncbi:MAG TPA: response regulator [Bryobacteraceae bacterium]|jgi:two-component system cell cycle response regulator DivK